MVQIVKMVITFLKNDHPHYNIIQDAEEGDAFELACI